MSKSAEKECEDESKKILEEKIKRRKFLRNYFQKQKSDPFKHALNEGGAVFDSAIQRYSALQVSGFDYFKPSLKNANLGILFVIVPMVVYGYMIKTTRDAQECKYRGGEVAYRDRRHKFIG